MNMYACIYGPDLSEASRALLLDCAYAFSPRVEQTAPGAVVLDIHGLDRLFGSARDLAGAVAQRAERLGIKVNIGVAQNPDAAVHAAQGLSGITVIPPGKESEMLESLPLGILAPPPEFQEAFELWGLRCFRDLAALPEMGVAERLGPEGVRLQKLARGAGDRPLVAAGPPPDFEASVEFEHPVMLLEPLLFILGRLLHELFARLEMLALAAIELRLRLQLENQAEHARNLRLPFPTRNHKVCLKLLQLDLESRPPQAPIVGIRLCAEPARSRVIQHGLFLPLAPEPERLEVTLARIANLVGEGNIGSAELVDTHRPGAFRMKRFTVFQKRTGKDAYPYRLALRVFRPPLRAQIEAHEGRPTRIIARGVRGEVVSRAGPWRSSGDWWTPEAWARDEWDVALSDGALYRVYRDRLSGFWFVEGSYD